MSSILDALKKLEADRAKAREATAKGFDTGGAGEDVFGRKPGGHITVPARPAAVVGSVLVIGLIAFVALRGGRPAAQPPQDELQLTQATAPAPTVPAPQAPKPQEPAAVAPVSPDAPPASEPVAPPAERVAPRPQQMVAAALEAEPAPPQEPPPSPATPTPTPTPPPAPEPVVVTAAPPAAAPPALPQPPQEAPPPVEAQENRPPAQAQLEKNTLDPSKLYELPMLRHSERVRFGLEELQINMPRPANKRRPLASAIINLQPVFVGETIPGTPAILVGVDMSGAAIEVEGRNFYVRFGRGRL